jgi:hypothetical protein
VTVWEEYLEAHRAVPWPREHHVDGMPVPEGPEVSPTDLYAGYVAWMVVRDPDLTPRDSTAFSMSLADVPWVGKGRSPDHQQRWYVGLTAETRQERAENSVIGNPMPAAEIDHLLKRHWMSGDFRACEHPVPDDVAAERAVIAARIAAQREDGTIARRVEEEGFGPFLRWTVAGPNPEMVDLFLAMRAEARAGGGGGRFWEERYRGANRALRLSGERDALADDQEREAIAAGERINADHRRMMLRDHPDVAAYFGITDPDSGQVAHGGY